MRRPRAFHLVDYSSCPVIHCLERTLPARLAVSNHALQLVAAPVSTQPFPFPPGLAVTGSSRSEADLEQDVATEIAAGDPLAPPAAGAESSGGSSGSPGAPDSGAPATALSLLTAAVLALLPAALLA